MARSATGLVAGFALWSGCLGAQVTDWVAFSSEPDRTSDHPPATVRGFLAAPASPRLAPGLVPGVVLLHGCDGPRPFQRAWAQALAAHGFAALLVDSLHSRDRVRRCDAPDSQWRDERVRDARGALRHLASHPGIDPVRLALMGWGDAPVLALAARATEPRLRAAIVIEPACVWVTATLATPALVLGPVAAATPRGEASAEHACPPSDLGGSGPGPVRHALEHAPPGFDDPDVRDAGDPHGRRYEAQTHARAIALVRDFLINQTERDPARGAPRAAVDSEPAGPGRPYAGWLIDPSMPGPDLPPVGASLFDRVFAGDGPGPPRHDLPYPFERLLARLREAFADDPDGPPALAATLIPYGRSLQRHAAAPHYASSPRIVVAATGEPDDGVAGRLPYLRDRLFIGYQPAVQVLEVISYNEEAGRFEFQVVRDYARGATPRVGYARRAVCVSCHQNQAPMFPEAGWDETSANPRVVRHLTTLGRHFEGVPVNGLGPSAAAVDNATDRASTLAALQPLWRDGCEDPAQPAASTRCRAGGLLAMLQLRLSAAAGFDDTAPLHDAFAPLLARRWAELWPDGALVPEAGLPNRDPLLTPDPTAIPGALDPLRPRPPAVTLRAGDPRAVRTLLAGLGSSLPAAHIVAIDARLAELADASHGERRRLQAPCEVVRRGIAGRPSRVRASCATRPGVAPVLGLEIELAYAGGRVSEGEVAWLDVAGARYTNLLATGRVDAHASGRQAALTIAHEKDSSRVRLRDASAIEGLTLSWGHDGPRGRGRGEIELRILATAAPLEEALEHLADQAAVDPDHPLGHRPFHASRLGEAVLRALGAQVPAAGAAGAPALPPPSLDASSDAKRLADLDRPGPVPTFVRRCSGCHGSAGTTPPGFLAGRAEEVRTALAQCAPRILHRLELWRLPARDRPRSPMPPVHTLGPTGSSAQEWATSAELESLRTYLTQELEARGVDVRKVLDTPYEHQPACLLQDQSARGGDAQGTR
jgi:dienelactone hydrolase/mono/diheme cytochrome c family protein